MPLQYIHIQAEAFIGDQWLMATDAARLAFVNAQCHCMHNGRPFIKGGATFDKKKLKLLRISPKGLAEAIECGLLSVHGDDIFLLGVDEKAMEKHMGEVESKREYERERKRLYREKAKSKGEGTGESPNNVPRDSDGTSHGTVTGRPEKSQTYITDTDTDTDTDTEDIYMGRDRDSRDGTGTGTMGTGTPGTIYEHPPVDSSAAYADAMARHPFLGRLRRSGAAIGLRSYQQFLGLLDEFNEQQISGAIERLKKKRGNLFANNIRDEIMSHQSVNHNADHHPNAIEL